MNTEHDYAEEVLEEVLEEVGEMVDEELTTNESTDIDPEREYITNRRRELGEMGVLPDQWVPTRNRSRFSSSLFSMTPPTGAPPPRLQPASLNNPSTSRIRIRELDYSHILNQPPDRIPTPSIARSRPTSCNGCGKDNTLTSKKHMTCYDCLVHFLTTSKIFVQGFDITSKRDSQMCIVCLDTVKHIGSRYVICIDCLITRLGDLNLLKFTESDDIHPLYVAIDTSYEMSSVDWQRKKYFPCDICSRDNIEDTRTERICMDCLMDKLLDSPYFTKVKRRIYS